MMLKMKEQELGGEEEESSSKSSASSESEKGPLNAKQMNSGLKKGLGGLLMGKINQVKESKISKAKVQALENIANFSNDFFAYEKEASYDFSDSYLYIPHPIKKLKPPPKLEDTAQDIMPGAPSMPITSVEPLTHNYSAYLSELWGNMEKKFGEKVSDSRRMLCEELMSIQGRHRQFYKVQFDKH